jgi:hypothetical protein
VTLGQEVDPHDTERLEGLLTNWLKANRWDEALWSQFSINVGSTEVRAA